MGKQTRVKFSTTIHNIEGILDYIHTDVWGPTKTASLGGKHYFVTFVDDFSRRVWVYTMKSKDEVFETFLVWKKMVENQTRRKIKVLRYDNGTEYRNDQFSNFCKKEGISWHFTVRAGNRAGRAELGRANSGLGQNRARPKLALIFRAKNLAAQPALKTGRAGQNSLLKAKKIRASRAELGHTGPGQIWPDFFWDNNLMAQPGPNSGGSG